MKFLNFLIIFFLVTSCSSQNDKDILETTDDTPVNQNPDEETPEEIPSEEIGFYYGADLSYVNEMEDCGAAYKNSEGTSKDPYKIFEEAGANLIRIRLWHSPDWTEYSNYEDVKKSISRAKAEGMKVLLDFHYSDTWADPAKQEIPAAWEAQINNTEILGDSLYNYTYKTLKDLDTAGLLPDIVQVGNETNGMILQKGELQWPIDWERNSSLLNKGIKAVRDISEETGEDVEVMLHIAQPENGLWWFKDATENGVTDFDWIGLSYYPIWSDYKLDDVSSAFKTLIDTYGKKLMVVETAYPFTMENIDPANNILNNDALIAGYPATQQGQLDYLNKLQETIESAGGEGLIYWEPAWVSTGCNTLWGQGSHWDNAVLFDHENQATLGMQFYGRTQ
ncbi:glycoside hydrolase family 53 protein [Christiangramia forsetii]|uniref:Arabinogalactan endo-beta-1,4-galactanase n=2 Tax=Christiangramia forsetii TaxID=411153 RepID=A0LXC8_CHRFK|nr:glycosyl hydrolase 53 family protein [Christiangramia forsetii]GGG27566.1 arabinogalactan endo-beta-1,4-galactanase [Christiangramia forsetii]CAL65023.1 glycosyl hydrolase, family 53-likely arabinogalactan 1,4-beta-galactosidase [Christiangramia forsetii KT0803]